MRGQPAAGPGKQKASSSAPASRTPSSGDTRSSQAPYGRLNRLAIPLAHVASAAPAEAGAREWLHGIRPGGTHIPGVISAGRFYSHGTWVF